MTLVILIGASGSGKTTIAHAIAKRPVMGASVFFFDSIGVPSIEEMIRECGSGEAWQRTRTVAWMLRLAEQAKAGHPILFEGQTRFSFLAEGAAVAGGLVYTPILVDCDDEVRTGRLTGARKQPELANRNMMNWARHLRTEAAALGCPILDTSRLALEDCIDWVSAHLRH